MRNATCTAMPDRTGRSEQGHAADRRRVTDRCDVLTQIGPAAGVAGKIIQPSHADLIPLAARDLCKQLFDPNP